MKVKVTVMIFLIFIFNHLLGQGSINHPIVKSYELDVSFNPDKAFIKGKATIEFESNGYKKMIFFLHGELEVDSIIHKLNKLKFEEEKVFYSRDYSLVANKVVVNLTNNKQDEKIIIHYSGYVNPSKARSASDYMRITKEDGVLLRSYGYSLWFPVFLYENQDSYKVDFTKVIIRTPKHLNSVFAGNKRNEYIDKEIRVTAWSAHNLNIFDAQCTAREYAVLSEGQCFVYHLNNNTSLRSAGFILEFLKKISTDFKKYYRKINQGSPSFILEMPEYGNISNANVTGISSELWGTFNEQTWPKSVLAHELVHPFVQLELNQDSPFYAFVIEGFPSYFHLPILENYFGKDWYDNFLKKKEENYLIKKKTGKHPRGWPLPKEKPILELNAQDIGEYKDTFILNDRVLLFFNYLRKKMGKDVFWKFSWELFHLKQIDYNTFENLVLKYLPDIKRDINIWLWKNDYPERFYIRS